LLPSVRARLDFLAAEYAQFGRPGKKHWDETKDHSARLGLLLAQSQTQAARSTSAATWRPFKTRSSASTADGFR
jgi:hypothetical protein